MKKLFCIFSLSTLLSCENTFNVEKNSIATIDPQNICAGKTVAGITGTANCVQSETSPSTSFFLFSARHDNSSLNFNSLVSGLINNNFVATREVATIKDAMSGDSVYTNNYSVIPRPLEEVDGIIQVNDGDGNIAYPIKSNFLDTIVGGRPSTQCGISGDIEARIDNCRLLNTEKSFYSGAQYGFTGEGDWKLVTRTSNGFEVWRDERTKLLWSDLAQGNPLADPSDPSHPTQGGKYNWYQAAGYSKSQSVSIKETTYNSGPGEECDPVAIPGEICQPASGPISVCADVINGEIAAGGSTPGYTYMNPEHEFKGNLSYSDKVVWRLPAINDWKLAEVNGIKKVLPNINIGGIPDFQWASTTAAAFASSSNTAKIFLLNASFDAPPGNPRYMNISVRCVGFSLD